VLSYLDRFAEAGIEICGQIVLCKGLNDGDELIRTMHDLATLRPAVKSVSVVPAGMTKFREGLYPLEPFTAEDCRKVIETVNSFGDKCLEFYGTRIVFCSDEFYLKAGLPLPDDSFYEDYSQIENGVGMLTSFRAEFEDELSYLDEYTEGFTGCVKSVATGAAAYEMISSLAARLCDRVDGLDIKVYKIDNDFFGHSITVAGLITGRDLALQLEGRELGDELIIPDTMLKCGEQVFLCDMTVTELSERLGVRVTPTATGGADFIRSILSRSEGYQQEDE